MNNIKTCDYPGCSNTFDIDNNEGIIVTKLTNKEVIKHFYCCIAHKE